MASVRLIVGIIGNIIYLMVFAAPIRTFWRVVKNKSTENYKGTPYITTLLSTSLWTFYGIIKPDLLLLIANAAGVGFQLIYVTLFLIYSPRDTKVKTAKWLAIWNVSFLGAVIAITLLAMHESLRISIVGILSAALTIGMYAAPLSAMITVIKTKSVKYMPFLLTFLLFLSGAVWSIYAAVVKDKYIGVPFDIGLILGSVQLILYIIYRNNKSPAPTQSATIEEKESVHEENEGIEMPAKGENEDEDEEVGNMTNISRAEGKTKSMPKTSVDRQYSLQKLKKTVSSGAYELLQHSSWANGAV